MQILKTIVIATATSFCAFSSASWALPVIFTDSGATAEDIEDTVNAFRDALGPFNAPVPVAGNPNGRRQINWDAAPDAISDPNLFPGDFFNANVAPRARGIEFSKLDERFARSFRPEAANVTGFKLSSTQASGTPVNFGFGDNFQPFSRERLFAPLGGTVFQIDFFDPTNPNRPATSRGIGLVFSDVEQARQTTDGIQVTSAGFATFDADGAFLETVFAPVSGDGGLSFAGIIFDDPSIASVVVAAGNVAIDARSPTGELLAGVSTEGQSFFGDAVVLDDVIFGEPAPVPLPATGVLLLGALAAAAGMRRRALR